MDRMMIRFLTIESATASAPRKLSETPEDCHDDTYPPIRGRWRRRDGCAGRLGTGPRAGETKDALQQRVYGKRSAHRSVQGLRRGYERRFRLRTVLGQYAVQTGHRARRAPARESRALQSCSGRYLQADSSLVADDLGVSVSRLRPPGQDVQE